MKYVIDEESINKSPLSLHDVIVLLSIIHNIDIVSTIMDLVERGYIIHNRNGYYITKTCRAILEDILLRAEKIDHTENLTKLAERLVTLFPEGRKPGTSFMWRCSVKECAMRLREFEKMFGRHSHDDIEDATKRYIDSFGDDKTLMRTLKCFIWKQENHSGIPEFTSDLATWIENKVETKPIHKQNLITL